MYWDSHYFKKNGPIQLVSTVARKKQERWIETLPSATVPVGKNGSNTFLSFVILDVWLEKPGIDTNVIFY